MEIKFDKVMYNNANISFDIDTFGIYSFMGNNKSIKSLIINLINGDILPEKGSIKIEKNVKIGICKSNPYETPNKRSIKEYLKSILIHNNYKEKDIKNRINQSLKLVNMDEKYLNKKIKELSYVEAKKISLISALIHNPKIVIIEDYTDGIIYNDKKEFKRLIRLLKTRYKKIVILLTKDTSFCYEISDYIYLHDDKKIVKKSNKSILKNIKLLKKLELEIPPIIEFINECKKSNHEIDDYDNVLDLIKCIYREVE